MAISHEKVDLALNPAERTAQTKAPESSDDVEALFSQAEEITIGDDRGEFVVIGAGLVGALCAIVLIRKGFKVHMYERYQDIRSIPAAGRSVNLSVTSRGLRSIRALGGSLHDDLMKLATPVSGRIIHMPSGQAVFQRYGKDDSECNYSVSRVELNRFLIDACEKAGAIIHFNHVLSETSDFSGDELVGCVLHFNRGSQRLRVKAKCPVIGCDGAGSRVRYALRRCGLTDFSEDLLTRGYKEVLFPKPQHGVDFGAKGDDGGEACPGSNGLHIWPRGEHMLMTLVNIDGSFTGTFFMTEKGEEESFESYGDSAEGRARCTRFIEKYYNDAAPHVGGVDELVRQITTNPSGLLGTVFTSKWAIKGKVLLIGDASHAMVPFFGQGCNCGFEDTLWLSRLLDKYCGENGVCVPEMCTGENLAACFEALEKERKPNADAICDMALENFVEMRDKTGDVKFQQLKKVENRLENLYGDVFRSRYAMVCYGGDGNVSYANAQTLGKVQMKMLDNLIDVQDGDSEEVIIHKASNIDLEKALRLIQDEIVPLQQELGVDLSTVKH